MEDKCLTQMVSEPTRSGALLDLLFTEVGHVVVGGRLGSNETQYWASLV